jgi:hypothetical protein
MPRSRHLAEILALDPERDHQRIVHLVACYEFPWDLTRSLEFALFRTYGVPSISTLLDRTGEFARRPQQRYDDTDLIVSELMEHGYTSERGTRALRRMNGLHGRFDIGNDDFLYVLSTFIFEPIRFNARFGWRRMVGQERLAIFHFWRQVGRRMSIRDIPEGFDAFERWNRDYERTHYAFHESNRRVALATRELFASWFPPPLRFLVRSATRALLDEPALKAFGFERPWPTTRLLVNGALKARALFLRFLWPRRRRPRLRTEMRHRSRPKGYAIETLGPPNAPAPPPAARTEPAPMPLPPGTRGSPGAPPVLQIDVLHVLRPSGGLRAGFGGLGRRGLG